jgi:peptidylprolyl isomerase
VENFLAFCRGVQVGGRTLSYVGVPFTRSVKRFVVQAGDVVNRDGTGEVVAAC